MSYIGDTIALLGILLVVTAPLNENINKDFTFEGFHFGRFVVGIILVFVGSLIMSTRY